MPFSLHVVLYEPEIPPNTGNIIRLCANTGARLHLIEPLGFKLYDRELRRAGLDYHEYAAVQLHKNIEAFIDAARPARLFAFSTRAERHHSDVRYEENDALLFGPETRGLPRALLDSLPPAQRLRLPLRPESRSLNLSNAVAIAVYEAWRQQGFAGGA
jgi:tRNA (cytidine/uridine-2'-O-)-methyltransferase